MSLTVMVVVGDEPCVQPHQVNLTTSRLVAVVMTLTCDAKCIGIHEAVTPRGGKKKLSVRVGALNLYDCRVVCEHKTTQGGTMQTGPSAKASPIGSDTLAPFKTQSNKLC